MITVDNFKNLLETLGFQKHGEVYEKSYDLFDISLGADFSKKNSYTTQALSKEENVTIISTPLKILLSLNVFIDC